MQNTSIESEEQLENTDGAASLNKEDTSEKDRKNHQYGPGDPLTFVRVRFPGNAKSQPFLIGKRNFQYGQKVVAMSDRGMTVGYINSFPYVTNFKKDMLPLKSISKVATDEDIEEQKGFYSQEKKAEIACKRLIERFKLDMNITHVEFIQFGKKAVFYFTAPARIDFRELVKSLVGDLKMRIELRQISVRDRTAALGAIGSCGLQTCCSSFLKNYGNVNIKMPKNQSIALIPSKLNGVCGQIKCCMKYEDSVYTEKRKRLPKEGNFIQTANGDKGKVTRLHVLIEQFEMLTDKGVFKRYVLSQFTDGEKLPKEWDFPNRFDHITNETSEIIGLNKDDLVKGELYYENADDFDADEYLESFSEKKDDTINSSNENEKKKLNPDGNLAPTSNKPEIDKFNRQDPKSKNLSDSSADSLDEDSEPNFNKEEFNKSAEVIEQRGNRNRPNGNKKKKFSKHKNDRFPHSKKKKKKKFKKKPNFKKKED